MSGASSRYVRLTVDTGEPVECKDCGARNVNPIQHERWHMELTEWVLTIGTRIRTAQTGIMAIFPQQDTLFERRMKNDHANTANP